MALRCSAAVFLLTLLFASESFSRKRNRSAVVSHWRLIPRIHGAEICRDKSHAISWSNITLGADSNGDLAASADWTLDRSAADISSIVMILTRCGEAVSYNTCEYFQTWRWSVKACELLTADGFTWSNFIHNIKPTIRCPNPMKKGNCSVRDTSVDTTMLNHLPIKVDGVVWRVGTEVFDERSELYLCFTITVSFYKRRVRT